MACCRVTFTFTTTSKIGSESQPACYYMGAIGLFNVSIKHKATEVWCWSQTSTLRQCLKCVESYLRLVQDYVVKIRERHSFLNFALHANEGPASLPGGSGPGNHRMWGWLDIMRKRKTLCACWEQNWVSPVFRPVAQSLQWLSIPMYRRLHGFPTDADANLPTTHVHTHETCPVHIQRMCRAYCSGERNPASSLVSRNAQLCFVRNTKMRAHPVCFHKVWTSRQMQATNQDNACQSLVSFSATPYHVDKYKIYVFICGSHNKTVGGSDCVTLNDRMTNE